MPPSEDDEDEGLVVDEVPERVDVVDAPDEAASLEEPESSPASVLSSPPSGDAASPRPPSSNVHASAPRSAKASSARASRCIRGVSVRDLADRGEGCARAVTSAGP